MKVTEFTTIEECEQERQILLEKWKALKKMLDVVQVLPSTSYPNINAHVDALATAIKIAIHHLDEETVILNVTQERISYPNIDAGSGGDWIKKPWIKNP